MLGTCSKSVNEPSSDIANRHELWAKDLVRRRRTERSQRLRSDVCGRSGVQGREMRRGFWGLVAGLVLISAPPQEAFAQIQSSPPAAAVSYELPAVTVRAPNRPPAARRPHRTLARNNPLSPRQPSAPTPATGTATAVTVAGTPNVGSGPAGPPSMASQMMVSGNELNARPATRPGEVLEAVPGLIVTQHTRSRFEPGPDKTH